MTQPPDQQPPQGGFGAPQNPPGEGPGGFGAPPPPAQPPQMPPPPQAPPGPPPAQGPPQSGPPSAPQGPPPQPQPGYGYPQQAPQPGPYGQPQQAPGPYGQPQAGPYGQPQQGPYAQQPPQGPYGQQQGPYGYPQQQYPGAPVPPQGGGKNPFKGKPGVIIGAAVAGLLVVGAGVYFAVGGGGDDKKPVASDTKNSDDKPSPTGSVDRGDGTGDGRQGNDDLNAGRKPGEAKVDWLQTNDVALPQNGAESYGMWFAGDTVVRAMYKKVVGYGVSDGKVKWTLPFDHAICAAPHQATADGKIVIAYKNNDTDKSDCNQLQVVDLATGKGGWKKEIPKEGLFDIMTSVELTIAGNTVTASRMGSSSAFSVTDGHKIFGKFEGACQPDAFAGGSKLIAVEECTKNGQPDATEQVQELDPATGKSKWTFGLPAGWQVKKVYSVDPLVIYSTNEKKKSWNISVLTHKGDRRSQLTTKDSFQPECGMSFIDRDLQGCTGTAADANTLYLPTEAKSGANDVVAFDLNTGKEKWRVPADDDRTMLPLRMDGANLLAYKEPSYDGGGAVVSIPPTGGKATVVLQHPESTASIENSFFSKTVAYQDGRFFLMSGQVRGKKGDNTEKTMLVFGK
ncbi:PQQ-binding-like beta-propeller repeat protein [Streptomyces sp. NBC_01267]|uniref:outer membrane protein assembly factor BamB family protein n=1 Tax=unclassified Streptomyces TaxID=2593676 RepID=UPI0020255832|nr:MULTISPECIES: PQQ-binding-like beta-propeller repeat protein [unclassified Streptomyces]WSC21894.1 PQQ-binding-like beta-propeller repeat protein [Streptomyces sp. NBC_01766]